MNLKTNSKMQWVVTAALFLGALLLMTGNGHAEPLLWVVNGPKAKVYLFGSVHALKKGEPWRSPKIDSALKESGSLWLELTDGDDVKVMQPLVMKYGVDQEHPLSTRLDKAEVAKLDTVAKAAGIPGGEAALEPLKPWMAAITLGVAPIAKAGFDPASGVEPVLKTEFATAGKPIHGFETAEEQIRFFADMPEKTQLQYLTSSIDDFDDGTGKFLQMVAAWYQGDTTSIDRLFSGEFRDKYPALYQTLIVKRNEGFVRQIEELLKSEGTVFVAVGAGHLVGADGVPAMLQKAGVKVEQKK